MGMQYSWSLYIGLRLHFTVYYSLVCVRVCACGVCACVVCVHVCACVVCVHVCACVVCVHVWCVCVCVCPVLLTLEVQGQY